MKKYELQCSDAITGTMSVTEENEKIYIEVSAKTNTPTNINITLLWYEDNIRGHAAFSPIEVMSKSIIPNWLGGKCSQGTSGAPYYCIMDYSDKNMLSIACSDALNPVTICAGLVEETAQLECKVIMTTDYAISDYHATVLIDKRNLPFYEVAAEVVNWWETLPGYAPAKVPEAAKQPYYSTWYSFHQNTDANEILKELSHAKEMGCTGVIVDDGWQCSNTKRGYDYCGDWETCESKIPDMKDFVDNVHKLGMKFLLWYSIPFIGKEAKCRDTFRGKMLSEEQGVIDPRYPENREFLKNILLKAVQDWGLDGFKLDFIDLFPRYYPDMATSSTAPGKDFESVHYAVDVMAKDILSSLRKLNPDILIEFRQSYIGPLMRTYGNIFRGGDCPNDSHINRQEILTLRILSGNTAVHSDMIMWNYQEAAEEAAFQLTNIIFSVPQISIRYELMPETHRRMLTFYLDFWRNHKDTLLNGKMYYKDYHANYTYVSSTDESCVIGVVYGSSVATITDKRPETVIINATMNTELILDNKIELGIRNIQVLDCMGNILTDTSLPMSKGQHSVSIPINGMLIMKG